MKKQQRIGNDMKRNKLGYMIIVIVLIFTIIYLIDGVNELLNPYQGLGFSYKSMPFYLLKLIYSMIFLWGGFLLLYGNSRCWKAIQFAGIGILTSVCLFYYTGYVFRITIVDLFVLELLSITFVILLNLQSFASWLAISIPRNRVYILLLFMIINVVLNYSLLYLSEL